MTSRGRRDVQPVKIVWEAMEEIGQENKVISPIVFIVSL
jgi:hypothetical protein